MHRRSQRDRRQVNGLHNIFYLGFVLSVALLTSCQKAAAPVGGGLLGGSSPFGEDPTLRVSPLNDTTKSQITQAAQNSGLSSLQQTALHNLLNETPQSTVDVDLPKAITDALAALKAAEARGLNVSSQKLSLALSVIPACQKQVAALRPRSGQNFEGTWEFQGCAMGPGGAGVPGAVMNFNVTDPYALPNGQGTPINAPTRYRVQGVTNGQLSCRQDGAGLLQGDTWSSISGVISDNAISGKSGMGPITNSNYQTVDGQVYPCTSQTWLKTPKNPAPANYLAAVEQSAQCYQQAMILISPLMDSLFTNMDPQLANLLKAQIAGIGK